MNKKIVKAPLLILTGIAIGYLCSNLFIFSKKFTTDENINLQNNITASNKDYVLSEIFIPNIPETLTFCGETVPTHYFDVYESLDFEILANVYRHASTIIYIKRANRYFPEIEKELARQGIPDDMKYLCVAESGLSNAVSSSGATGFWQFMKTAAKEYKLSMTDNIDERYNQQKSTAAACEYLKKAYKKFDSWTLAAASYNMGMGGLSREIEKQKNNSYWDLQLNQETARYVYRIIALKLIMSNPKKYGYNIPKDKLYQPIETYEIKIDTTINNLVDFAISNETNYKILKMFNPWLRTDELPNPKKETYTIVLPKKRD